MILPSDYEHGHSSASALTDTSASILTYVPELAPLIEILPPYIDFQVDVCQDSIHPDKTSIILLATSIDRKICIADL
ncbi:MAG: hypothetical protein K2K29_02000 [Muribaculaceae bacterium]|nr:hypothetical protein [Muribaculaceae bacterium]